MSAGCINPDFDKSEKNHAARRGRDAFGTATRISASLFRRLSAFFGSVSDQDPKAAKFAVLTPGPGRFANVRNAPRVMIPPPSETPPLFRRVSPCVQSFSERRVCTRFHPRKQTWAVCAGGIEVRVTSVLETLVWLRFLRFSSLFRGRKRKQDKGLASQAPPQPPLLPAVRAVDGGFNAGGCGAF